MRPTRFVSSLFVSTILVAACTEERPTPRTSAEANDLGLVGMTHTTSAVVATQPQTSISDQLVNVGPNLREACGIDDQNRAPKFDVSKSNLSGNDRDVLSQVAACLTTGALQGRTISLVGRADPRGGETYNLNLGELRAQSTSEYLHQMGVDSSRIHPSSRGAVDAQGHDEATWRLDRRVDVELE
jgi:outer membrane protein OmpA-like peptidoglycan-associated protein